MILDPNNVPTSLHLLLPMAARWGIGDDYARDCAVESAAKTDLDELVGCLRGHEDAVFEWLEGPESSSPTPSNEYVAMTNLTLAIDYAKSILKAVKEKN
jgi:hypothetical protein